MGATRTPTGRLPCGLNVRHLGALMFGTPGSPSDSRLPMPSMSPTRAYLTELTRLFRTSLPQPSRRSLRPLAHGRTSRKGCDRVRVAVNPARVSGRHTGRLGEGQRSQLVRARSLALRPAVSRS